MQFSLSNPFAVDCQSISYEYELMGDIPQWLEHWNLNLKTLGSTPWWGRVRDSFSVPPSQLLCRLLCARLLFMCTAHTQICAHVKDIHLWSKTKRAGLTAGGMDTKKTHRKHKTREPKKRGVAPYCGCPNVLPSS